MQTKIRRDKYISIINKMQTVWLLRDMDIHAASDKSGYSNRLIRKWQKNYDALEREYYKYLNAEGDHKIRVSQNRMADKVYELVNAMTAEKIKNAPLNQLASAIGVLTDRYIRIANAKEEENDQETIIHILYEDAATGEISKTPPWATEDSDDEPALHSSFLREALRQNGTGQTHHNGTGTTRDGDLVARTDISDGESRLARPESDDEERDWHPD